MPYKEFNKRFKLGKIEIIIRNRTTDPDEDNNFFNYVSWYFPSESIYFWKWEINIQNRRLLK